MTIPEGGFREGDRAIFKSERGSVEFDVKKIAGEFILDINDFEWPATECTLLHRPFKVGDEVQCWIGIGQADVWDARIFPECLGAMRTRHASSTWRDHKDWSGE